MSAEDTAFDAMVESLADSVTTLEGDLKPLLENFAEISSKLPVLDQAKLNVLLAYSIESLLFSTFTCLSHMGWRKRSHIDAQS